MALTVTNLGTVVGLLTLDYGTGACFIIGTKINTTNGFQEIQNLKIGDYVLSFNPSTGEIAPKIITNTYIRKVEKFLEIELSNGVKIGVTHNHPFYIPKLGQFIDAEKLEIDTELLNHNGNNTTIISIKEIIPLLQEEVYDIKVDDFHTFFVEGVGVHNPSKPF